MIPSHDPFGDPVAPSVAAPALDAILAPARPDHGDEHVLADSTVALARSVGLPEDGADPVVVRHRLLVLGPDAVEGFEWLGRAYEARLGVLGGRPARLLAKVASALHDLSAGDHLEEAQAPRPEPQLRAGDGEDAAPPTFILEREFDVPPPAANAFVRARVLATVPAHDAERALERMAEYNSGLSRVALTLAPTAGLRGPPHDPVQAYAVVALGAGAVMALTFSLLDICRGAAVATDAEIATWQARVAAECAAVWVAQPQAPVVVLLRHGKEYARRGGHLATLLDATARVLRADAIARAAPGQRVQEVAGVAALGTVGSVLASAVYAPGTTATVSSPAHLSAFIDSLGVAAASALTNSASCTVPRRFAVVDALVRARRDRSEQLTLTTSALVHFLERADVAPAEYAAVARLLHAWGSLLVRRPRALDFESVVGDFSVLRPEFFHAVVAVTAVKLAERHVAQSAVGSPTTGIAARATAEGAVDASCCFTNADAAAWWEGLILAAYPSRGAGGMIAEADLVLCSAVLQERCFAVPTRPHEPRFASCRGSTLSRGTTPQISPRPGTCDPADVAAAWDVPAEFSQPAPPVVPTALAHAPFFAAHAVPPAVPVLFAHLAVLALQTTPLFSHNPQEHALVRWVRLNASATLTTRHLACLLSDSLARVGAHVVQGRRQWLATTLWHDALLLQGVVGTATENVRTLVSAPPSPIGGAPVLLVTTVCGAGANVSIAEEMFSAVANALEFLAAEVLVELNPLAVLPCPACVAHPRPGPLPTFPITDVLELTDALSPEETAAGAFPCPACAERFTAAQLWTGAVEALVPGASAALPPGVPPELQTPWARLALCVTDDAGPGGEDFVAALDDILRTALFVAAAAAAEDDEDMVAVTPPRSPVVVVDHDRNDDWELLS